MVRFYSPTGICHALFLAPPGRALPVIGAAVCGQTLRGLLKMKDMFEHRLRI